MKIIDLVAYIHADDDLMESTQPEKLQRVFGVLTGLFYRFVLQKNREKTVGMICHKCHAPGGMSEEAYGR